MLFPLFTIFFTFITFKLSISSADLHLRHFLFWVDLVRLEPKARWKNDFSNAGGLSKIADGHFFLFPILWSMTQFDFANILCLLV